MRFPLLILLALAGIELARRVFGTLACYVDLRYSDNLLLFKPHSALLTECIERVLLFPLFLF